MDIKEENNSNKVAIRDFNTPPTSMGRSSRRKISKGIVALKDTLDKMDLLDIFRAFHPGKIHTLFKCTWNIF